jgi:FKBP-type peptidyl-prolyl cis-trans isomerase
MKSMKPLFWMLSLLLLTATGCLKDDSCSPKSVESEQSAILAYASANSITATRHSSGLYYEVINPGSGATPTLASTVSVRYTGKLTNGTVFDSQTGTPVTFPLSGVIPGWQIGIPLIAKGGVIRLIIPSALAYGCTGIGSIPPNSILYFDVTLVDVL